MADEVHSFPDVLPELYQVVAVGGLQQIEAFGRLHPPGKTVLDQRGSGQIEAHADRQGSLAGLIQVALFVPAEAEPNADVGGVFDRFGGALMVQNVKGFFPRENRFMHQDPAELDFPAAEQILEKILLDVKVLMEEGAQCPLVDVRPHPHQGEFEKTGHGRRQGVDGPVLLLHVHQQSPGAEGIEKISGRGRGDLPEARRFLGSEGLDRQQGDSLRLPFAEKHPQDPEQKFRRRSPLGKAVQAFGQPGVGRFQGMVSHRFLT